MSSMESVEHTNGDSTCLSSSLTTATCTNEEMQATLNKFRDLCGTLRKHFRGVTEHGIDTSDEALFKFSCAEPPKGFAVLRGALSYEAQLGLARKATEDYAFYPHNNITALGKALPAAGKPEAQLKKIRWSCLGMNYDWTNRKYVEGWKSDFPADLAELCASLANQGGFEGEYIAEAAIVNFYTPAQMMGPHRDDAELTMKKPIVSISLGCDAIFCIENKPFDKESEVACVWVRSGDVVVMGGESREALHGVAVTMPESFNLLRPQEGMIHADKKSRGEDKRLIEFLTSTRININVRQVEDSADPLSTFEGRRQLHLPSPTKTTHSALLSGVKHESEPQQEQTGY